MLIEMYKSSSIFMNVLKVKLCSISIVDFGTAYVVNELSSIAHCIPLIRSTPSITLENVSIG